MSLEKGLLYTLEESGDIALMVSREAYTGGRNDFHGDSCYHVWHGERWVYCGKSYQEALMIYREEINE